MGINYSKIICADETRKCTQTPPIPYQIYAQNIKKKTPQQIHQYVCGNKPGIEVQCCDPYDPAANEVVKDDTLIKVKHQNDGTYSEFHICRCPDKSCRDQYCPGFRPATQYEKCRARAVEKKNEIEVSPHVYKVVAANTYTNCYQLCSSDTGKKLKK